MNEVDIPLLSGEHLDQLGYHGLRIIQNPNKFKFTIDAFLLAGFVKPKPEQTLVDLGSGGGVLSLLFAGQDKVREVRSIEIQPELAEMSRRSVALNQLEQQIQVIHGDLRVLPENLRLNSFDHVISNPPFYPVGQGLVSENKALAMAKFEVGCTLKELIKTMAKLVKGNGRVSLIYPSERLSELIAVLYQFHLTPKRICLIFPYPGTESNLVLLEARPGAKDNLKVLPPFYIYQQDKEYSEAMKRIFHGEKI